MCENVNINVSETNETINIVATEVQEVIDINVFETAEDVTLNITEQLIQVNVNKVTAAEQIQSDWAQTDNEALDFIKNKPTIPTNTSDLVNDGEDGVNPFITALDVPNYTSVVKHIVKNDGTALITKGTAVYVTSSNGTNMLVGKASNTSEATSSKTMGLMQSDITTTGSTQTGYVITEGLIEGLNTQSATAGDPVWLGVNGALIYGLVNKPYAPAHLVFIGIVTKVSAGNGEIFVKVQNGFELKEIHDVDIITTTPINGHLLGFDGTLWVNKTIATWLGFTPENVANKSTSTSLGTSDTLYPTQNAVKVYADTKFTLPSLTSGSVLFSDGTTIAQKNASFFWDNTNNRLGIGSATPVSRISVVDSANTVASLTANAASHFNISRGTSGVTNLVFTISSVSPNTAAIQHRHSNIDGLGYPIAINPIGGNVQIGTTTDAGFKLDVNGTARVSGTTTITPAALTGTAATSALDIAQTWNTTGTPTAIKLNITDTASNGNSRLLDIQVGGASKFIFAKNGNLFFGAFNNSSNIQGDDATRGLVLRTSLTTTVGSGFTFSNLQGNIANLSSISNGLMIQPAGSIGFNPTSGTGLYNSIHINDRINQTGGANGITRGLYINPTLTAAADFRAIEVVNGITILGASTTAKASLRIPSGTAPTTPTNGDIWFDGTNLKMQIGGVTKTFTLL